MAHPSEPAHSAASETGAPVDRALSLGSQSCANFHNVVAPLVGHNDAPSIAAPPPKGLHYSLGLAPSRAVVGQDVASLVRLQEVQQVAGGAGQPIKPGHHKHVTRPEPLDHPGVLGFCAGRAAIREEQSLCEGGSQFGAAGLPPRGSAAPWPRSRAAPTLEAGALNARPEPISARKGLNPRTRSVAAGTFRTAEISECRDPTL